MSGLLNFELLSKADLMFSHFSDALAFLVGLVVLFIIVLLPVFVAKVLEKKIYFLEKIITEDVESEEELYDLQKEDKEFDRKY